MRTRRRGRRTARYPVGSAVLPSAAGVGVLIAVAALVLGACAAPGSPAGSSGPSGSLAARVAGRTFLSTTVTGHELVPGSTISIEFHHDGRIGAGAGCNTMSGAATWTGDLVAVGELAMTEMGCRAQLMDQDTWLAGLLRSGLRASLSGDDLTLTAGDVTVRMLDRRVAEPDRPLQGTTWILDGIIVGGGASSVPRGITATLRIADGRIHYFDGLNPNDGAASVHGDTVRVTDVGHGGAGCAAGQVCSVDMSVLAQDFSYHITAGSLTVTGTGDRSGTGLMFHARDALPGTSSPQSASPQSASPQSASPQSASPQSASPQSASPQSRSLPPTGTPRAPSMQASPGPVAGPGSVTVPTFAVTGKSLPGGHDSIPPQPSPASVPGTGSSAGTPTATPADDTPNPLRGRTFRLTGLFTDAGGIDTMYPDARYTITFGAARASADSSCGPISYPDVRYYTGDTGPMVDLGSPSGPGCSLGADPSGVPAGALMVVVTDGRVFLSTGLVGWWFEPAG